MEWMTTLDADRTGSDAELAARISESLTAKRLVLVRGTETRPDALRARYDAVLEAIGEVLEIGEDFRQGGKQTGHRWLEIRYDAEIPDMVAFRHSKNAQPWHTDESYIPRPCDVMAMYCVRSAPAGGATNYVAVEDVEALVADTDSALHALLRSVSLRYRKADQSRLRPILAPDGDGAPTVNFNYFCLDPESPVEHHAINERLFRILNHSLHNHPRVFSHVLQPGDCVLWWDHYLLHGREAFRASRTGDRVIYKTGIRLSHRRPLATRPGRVEAP